MNLGGTHSQDGTVCVRLVEAAGGDRIPVAGSDTCSSTVGDLLTETAAFSLPIGNHVYTLQAQGPPAVNGVLLLTSVRIVAEWTELTKSAESLAKELSADKQDAFFELVLHPIKASSILSPTSSDRGGMTRIHATSARHLLSVTIGPCARRCAATRACRTASVGSWRTTPQPSR